MRIKCEFKIESESRDDEVVAAVALLVLGALVLLQANNLVVHNLIHDLEALDSLLDLYSGVPFLLLLEEAPIVLIFAHNHAGC